MEFITSTIVSGIIYDLMKKGIELSYQRVFGNFWGNKMISHNTLYKEFLDEINQKKTIAEKEETIDELLNSEPMVSVFENELYNTDFAKRLDYIITLINQEKTYNRKINIDFLAEWLGFSSVNELKCYYIGHTEPDFKFIEYVANKVGVNATWFKTGINATPFQSIVRGEDYAERILKNEIEGQYVFAIKECRKRREILVMKKVNSIKYVVFPKPIVFHSEVGATGLSQLCSTYRFLVEISQQDETCLNHVHFVPDDIFQKLTEGAVYPGIVNNYSAQQRINILYDFIDISVTLRSRMDYKAIYGEEFFETQELVKQRLSK